MSFHKSIYFPILLLLLLCDEPLYGQLLSNYRYYGAESGIISRNAKCVLQDSKGMMWIGTQSGLNRFDGKEFLWVGGSRDASRLSGSVIKAIAEDNHGNLLVASEGGFDLMNLKTLVPRKIPVESFLDGSNIESILFFKTHSGVIYASINSGILLKLDTNQNIKMLFCKNTPGGKFKNVNWISEDSNGTVWLSSNDGSIYTTTAGLDVVTRIMKLELEVHGVANTRTMGLVITTLDGLYKFDYSRKEFIRIHKQIGRCTIIKEDRNDCVWISSEFTRLYKIHKGSVTEETGSLRMKDEFNYGLNCIEFDKKDNVWVGTNFGLVKFTSSPKNFGMYFSFTARDVLGKVNNSTRYITEDSATGDIYFASYSGIFRINHATHNLDSVWPESRKPIIPYSLLFDKGKLFIGTEGNGFYTYDVVRNMLHQDVSLWNPDLNPLARRFLISIYKDKDGKLWLGDYIGLVIYDPETKQMINHHYQFDGYRIDRTRVNQVFCSSANHLWLATECGLFELNEQRVPVRRFASESGLPANHVKCIEEDDDHNIWVGTVNGGVARYTPGSKGFMILNEADGLADNDVNGIVSDRHGTLWISTQEGLSQLNLHNLKFTNFRTEDGLPTNEFNSNSWFRSSRGDIYFGSINGLISIPRQVIQSSRDSSTLVVTKLYLHNPGEDVVKYWLDNHTPIAIPHNNLFFEIKFALTNYVNPERTSYYYRIDGITSGWEYLGSDNSLRFYELPSGSYELRIRATANNGVSSLHEEFSFPLTIYKAYYKTWWFMLLIMTITGLIIYAGGMYRIVQLKKLAEVRINLSSDLHDEVGSVLTRIAIQADMAKRKATDRDQAILDTIAQTSRTAVSNMRDVIWSTDARNDRITNLIDRMHQHATEMFEPVGINYKIKTYIGSEEEKLNMHYRQHFYLVFKEAVNNIVKHSNATDVEIVFSKDKKILEMVISDNGSEIHQNLQKYGQGLRNMKMRADKIKAEIIINTENGFFIRLTKKL